MTKESHLREFGNRVLILDWNPNKADERTKKSIFLGYAEESKRYSVAHKEKQKQKFYEMQSSWKNIKTDQIPEDFMKFQSGEMKKNVCEQREVEIELNQLWDVTFTDSITKDNEGKLNECDEGGDMAKNV